MAIFYVHYREPEGGSKWRAVQAQSAEAACAQVESEGLEVLRVAEQREAFAGTSDAVHPEPVRHAKPVGMRVGELQDRQLFWLIVKAVLLAMAIWWVISLVLGLILAAIFGVAFTVG